MQKGLHKGQAIMMHLAAIHLCEGGGVPSGHRMPMQAKNLVQWLI